MTIYEKLRDNVTKEIKTIYNYELTGEKITNQELYKNSISIGFFLHDTFGTHNNILISTDSPFKFIQLFLATIFSGNIPIAYPKATHRNLGQLNKIIKNSMVKTVVSDRIFSEIEVQIQFSVEEILQQKNNTVGYKHQVNPEDIAYIQYSSGSTGAPKGIVITHRTMMHGLQTICEHARAIAGHKGHKKDLVSCSWLPHYHDMGLIGGILSPLYANETCHLLHPTTFIKKPINWLKKISEIKANFSPAPNFAFDLCIKNIPDTDVQILDLSSWDVAYNGAENVTLEVMQNFAKKFAKANFDINAFFPTYGLAEYTLMASIRTNHHLNQITKKLPNNRNHLVGEAISCGQAVEEKGIVILDPSSENELAVGNLGEIALRGNSLFKGYFQYGEISYHNKLCSSGYFRTGDLGILDGNNELYVFGRIDDRISIRGKNILPNSLEEKISRIYGIHKAILLQINSQLLFVIETEKKSDFRQMSSQVFLNTINEIDIIPEKIIFVKKNIIPRTSSGKVRRNILVDQINYGDLRILEVCIYPVNHSIQVPEKKDLFRHWIKEGFYLKFNCDISENDENKTFGDLNLDSITAAILIADINTSYDWNIDITMLWEYATPHQFIDNLQKKIELEKNE